MKKSDVAVCLLGWYLEKYSEALKRQASKIHRFNLHPPHFQRDLMQLQILVSYTFEKFQTGILQNMFCIILQKV